MTTPHTTRDLAGLVVFVVLFQTGDDEPTLLEGVFTHEGTAVAAAQTEVAAQLVPGDPPVDAFRQDDVDFPLWQDEAAGWSVWCATARLNTAAVAAALYSDNPSEVRATETDATVNAIRQWQAAARAARAAKRATKAAERR